MESMLGRKIVWRVVSYGYDYDFDYARATGRSPRRRFERTDETRSGTVWSAGPVEGTAWVIPDQRREGEGYAVCVKVDKDGNHTMRPVDVERSRADGHARILATRKHRLTGIAEHLEHGAADVRVRTLAEVAEVA